MRNTNSNLATNLKLLLERVMISESELARRTGVGQSVIHRLASGETTNPKLKTLKPIAEYFSISIEHLLSGDLLQQVQSHISATKDSNNKKVPLLAMEQIVAWLDKKITSINSLSIGAHGMSLSDNCYATQIKDSTLSPRFTEGTYFVIDPDLPAKNRDFIVFCRNDDRKATIRQLFIDSDKKYLKTVNPDFRTIEMNREYVFLGTVVIAQIYHKDLTLFNVDDK